jgi:hypothetical protein
MGGYAGVVEMGLLAAFVGCDGAGGCVNVGAVQAGSGWGDLDADADADADEGEGADAEQGVAACERGCECVVDRWTGLDRGVLELGVDAGEGGWWEAVKWAPEGWGVVWTREGERVHPVQVEVVQGKRRGGYGG